LHLTFAMTHRPFGQRCLAAAALLLVVAGCGPAGEVRTYTVPKDPIANVSVPEGATTGEPTDRMLTAIVPEGTQAWFYKVVGPIAAVTSREDEILKFVAGVPPAAGAPLPKWSLPEGWTSRPGADGVTLAAIQIPAGERPLELTVTRLGWTGRDDDLLMNVNRWRGQMGLAGHESAGAMAADIRKLAAGDKEITLVDLRGRFRRSGMPPFAGGGMAGGGGNSRDLPAEHPPIGGGGTMPNDAPHGDQATTAASAPAPPRFDSPSSWEARPVSGMNRAVFRVSSGDAVAVVTVSSIPAAAGAAFTDPLENANMWREGVGMPKVTAAELKDTSEPIEVAGQSATFVRAIPEEGQRDATLATAVPHGDQIWFFKLKGARQLVIDRQDEFKTFLRSVTFEQSPPLPSSKQAEEK
jgi:hypothetical protein